jgi:hypothetical protein
VLDEIEMDFATLDAAAQSADRHRRIGNERRVARLDHQAVEEAEAATTGFEITATTRIVSGRGGKASRGGEAFQVERSRVARRVRLVIVQERAGLLLLEVADPVGDLERELSVAPLVRDQPPGLARLRQP